MAPGPFPTKGAWERLMPGPLAAKTGAGKETDSIPMGRMGEHQELANLACFLMAPGCDYINGAVIPIDGGQWLASNGNFNALTRLDDGDWQMIRAAIQSANQSDRAQRTT